MPRPAEPREYKTRLNIALQWIRHELAKLYTQKEPDVVPGFNLAKTIKKFWSQKINGHFHEFVVLNLNWLNDEIKDCENGSLHAFHVRKLIILKSLLTGNELPECIKLSEGEEEYFQIIQQSLTHPESEIKAPLYTPSSNIIIDGQYDITVCIQILNRIAVLEDYWDSFSFILDFNHSGQEEFLRNYIPLEQWFENQVYQVELFLTRLIKDVKSIEAEQAGQIQRPERLRRDIARILNDIRLAHEQHYNNMGQNLGYYFEIQHHAQINSRLARLTNDVLAAERELRGLTTSLENIKLIGKFPEPCYDHRRQPDLKPFACLYLLQWLTFTPSDCYFNHRFYTYHDFQQASWDDTLSMTHIRLVNHLLSNIATDFKTFWYTQLNFIKGHSSEKNITSLLRQAISIFITASTIPFILMLPLLGLATLPFKKQKESLRMRRRNSLLPYVGMIACDLFASAIEIVAVIGAGCLFYTLTQGINFPNFLAIPISIISPMTLPITLLLLGIDVGPLNACYAALATGVSLYFTTLLSTKLLYSGFNFGINSITKPIYNLTKDYLYYPIKELLFSSFRKCADGLNKVESNVIDKLIGHLSGDKVDQPDSKDANTPPPLVHFYPIQSDREFSSNDASPTHEAGVNNASKNPCNNRLSRL